MKLIQLTAIQFKVRGIANIFLSNLISNLKKSSEFALDSEEEITSLFSYVSSLENSIFRLVSNPSGTVVRLRYESGTEQSLAEVEQKFGTVCETLLQVSSQTSLPCLNSEPNTGALLSDSAIDSQNAEEQRSQQQAHQEDVLNTGSMDIEETVN